MNAAFPLQALLDLSHERMDEAARKLGELVASERAVEEKLQLLENYRDEYRRRFMEAASQGLGPDAWRNFTAFLGRLDEAVQYQQRVVNDSRQRTAQGQQAWVEQRNQARAFDTLAERHQVKVARHEARQEQKQTDEHAAKRYRDQPPDED
jgi:flagellar protein FliJ